MLVEQAIAFQRSERDRNSARLLTRPGGPLYRPPRTTPVPTPDMEVSSPDEDSTTMPALQFPGRQLGWEPALWHKGVEVSPTGVPSVGIVAYMSHLNRKVSSLVHDQLDEI